MCRYFGVFRLGDGRCVLVEKEQLEERQEVFPLSLYFDEGFCDIGLFVEEKQKVAGVLARPAVPFSL